MSLFVVLKLVGGLAALLIGGELLVRGASRLAAALGVSPIVIGLTVVAFGTSTPELAVSLNAALEGNADIAVANVVGSNIFNVLFILGAAALMSPLVIHSRMIRREVPLMVAVSAVMSWAAWDGRIGRIEGLLLFIGIVVYTLWLVIEARQEQKMQGALAQQSSQEYGSLALRGPSRGLSSLLVLSGLGIVMIGADWLVDGAVETARLLGVNDTVIGLTIVAAGTSLPEVVASIMATLKGERDIAVGNVVGSNIYNILAIVGLSGSIVPGGLTVSANMISFDIPVMLATAVLCWPFFYTGKRLSRTEGSIFLLIYLLYTLRLIAIAS